MIQWIVEKESIPRGNRILDLGCGNGHLLLELAQHEYSQLHGVDYAEHAIHLASQIAQTQGFSQITFSVMDILNSDMSESDLILDKGTFDAISLANPSDLGLSLQSQIQAGYVDSVARLLAPNGILLITSCNWTEDELIGIFKPSLAFYDRVKYPTFRFGGSAGQSIVTVAFKKAL